MNTLYLTLYFVCREMDHHVRCLDYHCGSHNSDITQYSYQWPTKIRVNISADHHVCIWLPSVKRRDDDKCHGGLACNLK